MIFKLFGRTIQIRNPVKLYEKDEPVYIETASEFLNQFGKPDVTLTEQDVSVRKLTEITAPFITRVKKGD